DQVGLVQRQYPGALALHRERQLVAAPGADLVVDGDRVIDGGQFVVPVRARRADCEVQVDLRRYPHPHRTGRPQPGPPLLEQRLRHDAPAMAANCSTVNASPRAPGSTPAAATIRAAASAPPAQPARAARSV